MNAILDELMVFTSTGDLARFLACCRHAELGVESPRRSPKRLVLHDGVCYAGLGQRCSDVAHLEKFSFSVGFQARMKLIRNSVSMPYSIAI